MRRLLAAASPSPCCCWADRVRRRRRNDRLIDQQSVMADFDKRRELVWQIERRLAEDAGRPIIFHPRQVTCAYPAVNGITTGVNSPYNEWRMEDAWLDR